MTPSENTPFPPPELVYRVYPVDAWSDPLAVYEQMGAETKAGLLDLLGPDWSFEGKRVLDFGCGAGRTLRHFLAEAEEAELWGVDVDERSIDWLRASLCPPLHARRIAHGPPTGLEPGSFDLIWAISVFTHLPQMTSLHWLRELHRLLRPGGLLIATYYGRWNSEFLAGEAWDDDRVGMNVLQHTRPWDEGGPVVLMSDWWVRAHWGRAFDILATKPQLHNFTWLLMQRREVELTTDDLERPEDDPREVAALRHNLRQVQREVEELTRRLDEARRSRDRGLGRRLARLLRRGRLGESLRRSRGGG